MAAQVKFISTVFLKENTTIQDNVDDNILVPYIYKVQDTHLQQVLGTTFYVHLQDAVVNSTLTTDEEDLIRDYIQKMVAEWTVYEVVPHLNYKFTNKAVSQQSSEFSQPTALAELKYLRQSIRDLAEFYTQRLTKFLCDNSTLFPTYLNPDAKENLRKDSKSYFNGIYIPHNGPRNIRTYNDPSDDCCD